ncbi:MarR family winged helix-turn-helix transcriptional regulator [Georgenia sp. Z1491]|uniref:MarR family winged helix-turn-helix transcriptional regulator n=1 Tax=Georgenia sp. Z1491 TaxID=3416707 RepID=UPI003CEE8850
MDSTSDPRWLTADEMATWLSLWSTMTWLPARLDAQLRRDGGLSASEYHVLSQVSMAPGGSRRLSEVAAAANLTLSHLSRVADRMARAGWLVRSPDPADGRFTLATLTDEGMRVVEAAAPGHVAAVREYVFDRLDAEQAVALGKALAVIADAAGPAPTARD